MADVPFQSLYRRYRPERFDQVRGQEQITTALRNAVRHDRVAHAYLFSGPRGTGKTSTARILAAALNCPGLVDGEPDGTCESCVAIRTGASLDVFELDAASNNGVDAMRDLVTRAALSSPGRTKVYIIDEVHMLTTGASNALLKTLEEPPGHVVFILATTDDQKVLPTIKSRTQHYQFRLLAPDILNGLVADINQGAGLGLDPLTLDRVVRKGNGSARDALSALDQAAAAGGSEDEGEAVSAIVEALIAKDPGAALVAIAEATHRGRDPHRLAVELVEHLRAGFLLLMAPDVAGVPADQRAALEEQARRVGAPATVRAMEVLGETLVAMRESLDTRVTFELAIVRLSAPSADASPAALLERIEAVERRLQSGAAPPQAAPPPSPPAPPRPAPRQESRPEPPPAPPRPVPSDESPPDPQPADQPRPDPPRPDPPSAAASQTPPEGRPTIGAMRQRPAPTGASTTRATPTPPAPAPTAAPSSQPVLALDRDELTKVWGDRLFANLGSRTRAVYRNGRWLGVDGATLVFALPTEMYRAPAEEKRSEVEGVLAAHFGAVLNVRFEIDDGGPPAPPVQGVAAEPEEAISEAEFASLPAAPDAPSSAAARLLAAFPGTEEVDT